MRENHSLSHIITNIHEHGRQRRIQCAFCIAEWEELWIGATLLLDNESVGSICPKCLAISPRQLAFDLSFLAGQMKREVIKWRSGSESDLDSLRRKVAALNQKTAKQWLAIIQNFEVARKLQ